MGLKPCLWAQGTRALRSLMPIQERDDGDSGRLKVTPSQRLPSLCLKGIFSSPSTRFRFPALKIFGNDFVCLLASFLNHRLPPKVRVQHVLLTTKSSTYHTVLRDTGSAVCQSSLRDSGNSYVSFLLPLLEAFCLYV